MKLSYGTIFFLILMSGCSRLPPLPENTEGIKQTPVFEVFGYARCSNCPIVEHAVDSLKSLYQDSIIVLEYHLRLLGDTLSPSNINGRTDFYNIGTSVPVSIIQGTYRIDGAEDNTQNQIVKFQNYYTSLRRGTDSVILRIQADTMGDSVDIIFNADSVQNIDTLSDALFVLITEDSIKFVQSGAEDSTYNNVVTFYKKLSGTLPVLIKFNKNNIEGKNIVGILQDTTAKNILSSTQRRF